MKNPWLISAAFATITTAIPLEISGGDLPASKYDCDQGYEATCCRDSFDQTAIGSLKQVLDLTVTDSSGGKNLAGCAAYENRGTWDTFTASCQSKNRIYGLCCQSIAASSFVWGEPSGTNCFPPPGPSRTPSKTKSAFNPQVFETNDGNLQPFNQQIPALEPIANLQVNSGDFLSYLPANIFGAADEQFKANTGSPFPDEFSV